MIKRICKICKEELPIEEFYSNGKTKFHYTCKKCSIKIMMITYIKLKDKAVEYLGGECKHCGIKNVIVLEFHHLDKSKKEANWNTMKKWTWERMKVELDKCILLCANCHKIEHATFYLKLKYMDLKPNG